MTIAEQLTKLSGVKQGLKAALTDKGINMSNVPFAEYPLLIEGLKENELINFIEGGEHLEIPKGVRQIAPRILHGNTTIRSVVIPDGVTDIGGWAFSTTGLSAVNFPNSIERIGNGAFGDCSNLSATLTFGNRLQSIGINAFVRCDNLSSIVINRLAGSVAGAPWGAPNATVVWTG
jgi:hypothetical protein